MRYFQQIFAMINETDETSLDEAGFNEHPTLLIHRIHLIILRLGLVAAAILLWQAATNLGDSGDTIRQPLSLFLMFVLNGIAFLLLFLAAFRNLKQWVSHLFPIVLVLIFLAYAQTDYVNDLQQGNSPNTDVWLFSEYSAQLLRAGENPYEHDMSFSFWVHRSPPVFSTPLSNGDMVTEVSYPALTIWIFALFQTLGIPTQVIYPLFAFMTMLIIFYATPRMIRPLVLIPILVEPRYFYFVFGGVNDIVWVFFIVIMLIHWEFPLRRAIWYGLACAFKQQAWLFAPFLLIKLWKEHRQQPFKSRFYLMLEAITHSSLVFLIFNLPFMVWNLDSWLDSVLAPLNQPMIVLGHGFSALMLADIFAPPIAYFSIIRLLILAVLLYLLIFHYDDWSTLIWIAPAIILWFGHRGLVSYWYFYAIPFVLVLTRHIWTKGSMFVPSTYSQQQYRITFAVVGVSLLLIIGSVCFYIAQEASLIISVQMPISTNNGRISRLSLNVQNNSDENITPRFSVRQWGWQPFFWRVESGPQDLAAHSQAIYTIYTDYVPFMFPIDRGAQIIVSDSQNSQYRASVVVAGDIDLRFVDAVPNGEFLYWQGDQPFLWGKMGQGALQYDDDASAIELSTVANESIPNYEIMMLDTWIPIPSVPISIRIKVPLQANLLPDLEQIYGYEIVLSGTDTKLWILFGDETSHGQLGGNWYYWMQATPRDIWLNQDLDIAAILAELDISAQAILANRQQVDFPIPVMNFRLLIAHRGEEPINGLFGGIHFESPSPDKESLIHDYLENPEVFFTWRANQSLEQFNFETAEYYLELALESNPSYRAAYETFANLEQLRGNLELSQWYLQQAENLGSSQG